MKAIAAAFVLLSAGVASAVEIPTGGTPARLNITSTTIGAWHIDNGNRSACDDFYGELLERLNLDASWESWVAGVRLDGSAYHPKPEVTAPGVTGNRCLEIELRNRYFNYVSLPLPEKIWAGYNGRHFEVTVGDSYVQFGRGLTLALRKTDQLGLDTTQRGVRARLLTDRLSGTLIAGITNINNVDEASGRYADDPEDGVIGLSADVRIVDGLRVGGSVAAFLFARPVSTFALPGEDAYEERWLVGGPRIEAPRITDWLGFYVEGVAQRRMNVDGEVETGYGLYGSATAYAGPLTILLEGKAYGDLAVVQPNFQSVEFDPVQYTALPTLERVQQPLEHPQARITGGRVRVDWTVSPDVAVYVNNGLFRDFEGYLHPEYPGIWAGTIHDPYVGVDARFGDHRIHAQAGVRVVVARGAPLRSDGHLEVDVISGLGGGSSIEFHVVHLERGKLEPLSDGHYWREGTLQLGYRNRPKYAISAILDYTTERGQPSVWYPGASAEWDFTESSNIRLFAGASRGGLKCVSGVCRVFPPFAGVKGVLTLRY